MIDRRDFVMGTLAASALAAQSEAAQRSDASAAGDRPMVASSTPAGAGPAPTLRARYAFSVSVFFKERIIIDSGKSRAYVPAIGGEIWGPRLQGRVVPYSGADFGTSGSLIAHYVFQAKDGALIYIQNYATIQRYGDDGLLVPPALGTPPTPARPAGTPPQQAFSSTAPTGNNSRIRFRTLPVFDAPEGPHAWLNRTALVGHAVRQNDPDHSIFTYYEIL